MNQYYSSPIGELILGSFKNKLVLCDWRYRKMRAQIDERIQSSLNTAFELGTNPLLEETSRQLNSYFNGDLKHFDLPIEFVGTDFQKSVWTHLEDIPYGSTASYLELSTKLGNPKAIRAVASANGANAMAIIVPCHRIIGSDNSLVGYAGGLPAKKKLLQLEGVLSTAQQTLF